MASSGIRSPPTCRSRRCASRRRIESFCWRVEQLAGEGGFALVTGAPGTGKSVTLRMLAERLAAQRDVKVGVISRPQAGLADFYREMGELFGVVLHPHNRWAGAKVLRERWQTHIDAAFSRPVLIVDEAQEMLPAVLSELRLLVSARLDSHILLTVVLAGDGRLAERLRSDEFLPLGSRMRVRLALERATPDELQDCLKHALHKAGAAKLMTAELIATLCDHAQGNLRALMNMAGELLAHGRPARGRQIDEKLFLETCSATRRHQDCGRTTAMSLLPVEPAYRPRRARRGAALAGHRAVVRTGRRHHRRRAQMLQILPRPRPRRVGRGRHAVPAPLPGATRRARAALRRRGRARTSCADGSRASAPPRASRSPISTSR